MVPGSEAERGRSMKRMAGVFHLRRQVEGVTNRREQSSDPRATYTTDDDRR